MENLIKKVSLNSLFLGVFVGILVIAGVRFFTYQPPKHTHYHANFAVYINGQREKFENPFYYQEITTCSLDTDEDPAHRVHMHDSKSDLIHVHAGAVTWGAFFQNIGWNIGKEYIETNKDLITNKAPDKLTFMINGKSVDDITTRVIASTDKLLVSYGGESNEELNKRFSTITDTAKEANTRQDPASCSGSHEETSFKDRLKNIF